MFLFLQSARPLDRGATRLQQSKYGHRNLQQSVGKESKGGWRVILGGRNDILSMFCNNFLETLVFEYELQKKLSSSCRRNGREQGSISSG